MNHELPKPPHSDDSEKELSPEQKAEIEKEILQAARSGMPLEFDERLTRLYERYLEDLNRIADSLLPPLPSPPELPENPPEPPLPPIPEDY